MDLYTGYFKKYNITDQRVKVVAGGTDRNETIMNIIDYIRNVMELIMMM